jgi:hypothetical protein
MILITLVDHYRFMPTIIPFEKSDSPVLIEGGGSLGNNNAVLALII